MANRLLHIATIVNDPAVYRAMRASMAAVGFTDESCRFTVFDNSKSNQHEPYSVLRQLATDGDEPYVMLCHQDLLFSGECSMEVLLQQFEKLTAVDPRWAIAGTAGGDIHGQLVYHMDDPIGSFRAPDLPRAVVSLDENLLILQRSHYPLPTPGLSGFHLYGTDLCLNAYLRGQSAYVIAFPVRHLSPGNVFSAAFAESLEQMSAAWKRQLFFGLIRTPCSEIRIAPFGWLRNALRGGRIKEFLRRRGICVIAWPWARSAAPEELRHG